MMIWSLLLLVFGVRRGVGVSGMLSMQMLQTMDPCV
jgi:hypothetical protein